MDPQPAESQFRFDKHRAEAVVTLVTNENIKGCFFTAASARRDGAERIGDLLNSETGFFPFENRKSTRLNSSHQIISYAVFCLKKKKKILIEKNEKNRPLLGHKSS